MEDNENIKFNFSQYRRHNKNYRFLIRIALYVFILAFLFVLIAHKLKKVTTIPEQIDVQIELE
jgi:hypothetical protein